MKKTKLILAAIVAILILSIGGFAFYTVTLKPVKAYENALQIMQDFKTAKFDLTYTVDMKMEMEAIEFDLNLEMSGDGMIDIENQKLMADMNFGFMGEQVSYTQIISDDTVFLKIQGDEWQTFPLTEIKEITDVSGMDFDDWKNYQFWSTVDPDIKYDFVGTEEVKGRDAYKYEVDSETLMDRFGTTFIDTFKQTLTKTMSEFDVVVKEDFGVDNPSFYVWVDKSSQQPIR